jgi:tRNA pseudouridine32 synthase/23S rRNA pseudouridine746 synthase
MQFDTIFENDQFLIIEKFGGISFEGVDGLLSQVRSVWPGSFGIHRLDKDTSGLMIFGKNKSSQIELSKMFQDKKIDKFYFALSSFRPKKKMGSIKGDLVKSRGGSYRLSKEMKNPSHTKFESLYFKKEKTRGFLLRPYTGQTHQLRVHLKSLGSAIIGDSRYGTQVKPGDSDRMYLASVYLKFEFSGKMHEFFRYPTSGTSFLDLRDSSNIEGKLLEMIKSFK